MSVKGREGEREWKERSEKRKTLRDLGGEEGGRKRKILRDKRREEGRERY